jgi:hypothetical protein
MVTGEAMARARERPGNGIGLAAALLMVLVVGGAVGILVSLVDRGWLPLDDGMLGHVAERVTEGDVPHVSFDDPYTGGQAYLHAWIFDTFGVDLLYLRYALIASYIVWGLAAWAILRRWLSPVAATIVASSAAVGSILVWPTPLPTWYTTIAVTVCAWLALRWNETGAVRYLAGAGVALGIGALFKLTALYALGAVVSIVGLRLRRQGGAQTIATALIWLPPLAVVALVTRQLTPSSVVYFVVPAVAAALLVERVSRLTDSPSGTLRSALGALSTLALGVVVVVVGWILWRYTPADWPAITDGWFSQPSRRLDRIRADPPSPLLTIPLFLAGVVLLRLADRAANPRLLWRLAAVVVVALAAFTGWSNAYLMAVFAVGLAVGVSTTHGLTSRESSMSDSALLLSLVAIYSSLVGFPHFSIVYVAYVAPLVGLALAAVCSEWRHTTAFFASVVGLALTTVLLTAGGWYSYGSFYPDRLALAPSPDPRASVSVHPASLREFDVATSVRELAREHPIWAGPTLAHLYYLAGARNVTRLIYEFTNDEPYRNLPEHLVASCVHVIVINHRPVDWAAPVPEETLADLQGIYEHTSAIGGYEIRWTEPIPECS